MGLFPEASIAEVLGTLPAEMSGAAVYAVRCAGQEDRTYNAQAGFAGCQRAPQRETPCALRIERFAAVQWVKTGAPPSIREEPSRAAPAILPHPRINPRSLPRLKTPTDHPPESGLLSILKGHVRPRLPEQLFDLHGDVLPLLLGGLPYPPAWDAHDK